MVQLPLPAARPVNEYACGEVNGALKVCELPHEDVTVSVPDAGALVKVILPDTVYVLVAGLQPDTAAVTDDRLQGGIQETGAV